MRETYELHLKSINKSVMLKKYRIMCVLTVLNLRVAYCQRTINVRESAYHQRMGIRPAYDQRNLCMASVFL